MGAAERRSAIMRKLYIRRHEKIANLAMEFGVSDRTIRRDIEVLSLSEPIYTQCGRYGGGVYIMEGYSANQLTLTQQEIGVLEKVCVQIESDDYQILNSVELQIIKLMLLKYSPS